MFHWKKVLSWLAALAGVGASGALGLAVAGPDSPSPVERERGSAPDPMVRRALDATPPGHRPGVACKDARSRLRVDPTGPWAVGDLHPHCAERHQFEGRGPRLETLTPTQLSCLEPLTAADEIHWDAKKGPPSMTPAVARALRDVSRRFRDAMQTRSPELRLWVTSAWSDPNAHSSHTQHSLHHVGMAVDLIVCRRSGDRCEAVDHEIGTRDPAMDELAQHVRAAGFRWVWYEPRDGKVHVHASIYGDPCATQPDGEPRTEPATATKDDAPPPSRPAQGVEPTLRFPTVGLPETALPLAVPEYGLRRVQVTAIPRRPVEWAPPRREVELAPASSVSSPGSGFTHTSPPTSEGPSSWRDPPSVVDEQRFEPEPSPTARAWEERGPDGDRHGTILSKAVAPPCPSTNERAVMEGLRWVCRSYQLTD